MSKRGVLLAIGALALAATFVAGVKVGAGSRSSHATLVATSAEAAQPARPAPILPSEPNLAATAATRATLPAAAVATTSAPTAAVSAPAGDDLIKKYYGEVFRNGPRTAKHVALTFDDGPSAAYNARFLALLKKEKVPATFFMIGRSVADYRELVRNTAAAGFEIGTHTMNHPNPARIGNDPLQHEMLDECELLQDITGKRPRLFRPPYGTVTRAEREIARNHGLVIVTWSIDTKDWEAKAGGDSIRATINKELHPGAIILMHEIKGHTIDALPAIIADIRAKGYEIVPVSQLIEEAAVAPPEALGTAFASEPTPIPPRAIPLGDIKDLVKTPGRNSIKTQ